MANCVVHHDLCVRVTADPEDDNIILIQETDFPDVVVRTSRENWLKFVGEVKNNEWDNV